ncbi:MAG TPA: glycosyltransferase [Acidimicrobiia bacterium]|nr:glycosyltransferase [Acidimicrobiia bacterium]
MTTLSVLMPVHNEVRTLRTIIQRVLEVDLPLSIELVCVDDGSTDGSWDVLSEVARADSRVIAARHPRNRGKGAALRTAIELMTGAVAVIQDADLEYDPTDIPRLIAPILDGRADAVYGSRFSASAERRVLLFWHSVGNEFITLISNALNDLNLTDIETGYKAVRADVLARLRLTADGFGIEPEITARLAQWGARLYEVPISYHGRTYDEGKHIGWRDGLEAIGLMLKYRFLDTRFVADSDHLTRQNLVRGRGLRRWVLAEFGENIGDRVLEVMPGPGTTSALLLDRTRLVLADDSRVHLETLQRRYGHLENISFVHGIGDGLKVECNKAEIDTVICLDALQRVDQPVELLTKLAGCFSGQGRIVIHVPQGPEIFGRLDQRLGHRQRFTRATLKQTIVEAGLEVAWIRDFNRLGRWFWQAQARDRESISPVESRLMSMTLPLARIVDRLRIGRGLSLLAVATKPLSGSNLD